MVDGHCVCAMYMAAKKIVSQQRSQIAMHHLENMRAQPAMVSGRTSAGQALPTRPHPTATNTGRN